MQNRKGGMEIPPLSFITINPYSISNADKLTNSFKRTAISAWVTLAILSVPNFSTQKEAKFDP